MNNDNTSQDIRKLSRTVLRQNDVDIIMNGEDGSFVAKDVKITPKFASIVEKIAKEKKERLEQMLHDFSDATEIWVPPVEEVKSVKEKNVAKKKAENKKDNKKEKPKKEKPNKKERIILEIDFIPDKKFDAELNNTELNNANVDVIFESDIKL